jgi:hypothetical protein
MRILREERLDWQSKTEGQLKKPRPGYLHYQKTNQTQRQEKLGASQDKSKLSHSNDWCTRTGTNTTSPKVSDTPQERKT